MCTKKRERKCLQTVQMIQIHTGPDGRKYLAHYKISTDTTDTANIYRLLNTPRKYLHRKESRQIYT